MTAREGARLLGRKGMWACGRDIAVQVRIVDARSVYGRMQVLVEPVSGTGQQWVAVEAVVGIDNPTFERQGMMDERFLPPKRDL